MAIFLMIMCSAYHAKALRWRNDGGAPVEQLTFAINKVNMNSFVLQADGKPVPQTTKPELIYDMLRALEVNAGDSVFEIGTGSGYSTALLATLAGEQGSVVSIDIEERLVERAHRLLTKHGLKNVRALVGDGRNGFSGDIAFSRIVAWATADHIPFAWCNQAIGGAVVVVPIKLLPVEGTTLIVKLRIGQDRKLNGEQVMGGSFVPLSSEPLPFKPVADVVINRNEAPIVWGSAEWARESETSVRRFTHLLKNISAHGYSLLSSDEDAWGFRSFLLAQRPRGFTTVYMQSTGAHLGYSDTDGLSVLSLSGKGYGQSGDARSKSVLLDWIDEWRRIGRPGLYRLKPMVQRDNNGWKVSVEVI